MTHENDPIDMQVQVGPSRKLRGVGREEDSFRQDSKAVTTVSYTHLTLPTTCGV